MRIRGAASGAAGAVVAAVFVLVVLPLLRLFSVVWSAGATGLSQAVGSASFGTAVRHSLLLAAAVTVTALPLGLALALILRRSDVPGRRALRVAVLLPVLVPDFVLGYSWAQAYGRGGFTSSALGVDWDRVPGAVQVWSVLVVHAVPVAYLVVAAGLATRAEPQLERAARNAGAGPVAALRTVTLPLLGPSIAAASVLVFVLALGAFAVPEVLGAPSGFRTVTTQIYADLSVGGGRDSFVEAVTLALLLTVLALVCVAPADAVLGRRLRAPRTAGGASAMQAPPRPALGRGLAAGLVGYVVVSVGLPLLALVLASLTRAVGLPPTPGNWGTAHYRQVLTPRTLEALGRSAVLSVAAATLLLVLGTAVALLARSGRAARAAGTLVTLTLVLPGSSLAVAVLLSYRGWLGDGTGLILIAYLAKFWALAQRPMSGAVDRLVPEEWWAARGSGARPWTAARTVLLRTAAPTLLGAWLLCLLSALHEVTMSSLLYGPGSETFAVVVLNSEELGRIGPTAALSVVLTLLVLIPAGALGAVAGRMRGGGPRSVGPRPAGTVTPDLGVTRVG